MKGLRAALPCKELGPDPHRDGRGRERRMKKIKVFILYDHPLFGLGLEKLLKQERGIEVVGTTVRSHMSVEQMKALRPDVIMVEGGEPGLASSLWEALKESLPGRVITVELDENRATVYTSRQVPAAEVKDLVKAVKSGLTKGNNPNRPQGDYAPQA